MSQIISPKTNKLVRVGSKNFSDLLKDPKYRDYLLNPDSPHLTKGTVSPSGSPPFERKALSSLKENVKLPTLPHLPGAGSPPNKVKLPPLPVLSPRYSSPKRKTLLPISSLPPLPPISAAKAKIPLSPSQRMIYSPPSPSPSLKNIPMPILPPIKTSPKVVRKTSRTAIRTSPKVTLPTLPLARIPTLEETLERTKQPAKRAQLEEMIEKHREEEGRGIKTRGWRARSPTRGKERHQLKEECGDACFLLPEKEKFPICASPRMTGGVSRCEIDCGGVQSALVRANQWGYNEVAAKAEKLLERCKEGGLKHFTPSPIELPSPRETLPSPKLQPSLRMGGRMDMENHEYHEDDRHDRENYGVVRRNVRRSVLLGNGVVDEEERHVYGDKWNSDENESKKKAPEPSCGCGK